MTKHKKFLADSRRMNDLGEESIKLVFTSPVYWQRKDHGRCKILPILTEIINRGKQQPDYERSIIELAYLFGDHKKQNKRIYLREKALGTRTGLTQARKGNKCLSALN